MNVLLIDDHPMVNSGITAVLEETGRFKVFGEAASLNEAKQFIETNKKNIPSLIILDIMLSEENGLDFIPFLKKFCKNNKIIMPSVLVCSVIEEPFRIQSSLDMGASGFISKAGSKKELLHAIDIILSGGRYISGEHSIKVKNSYDLYSRFTKREVEIFNMIKNYKSNKQIAQTLGLSIRTVENHISNIYYKAGVKDRQGLIEL